MEGRILDEDKLMRISLLIGIFKALNICHGQKLADRWVTLQNKNILFAGEAPVDYMCVACSMPVVSASNNPPRRPILAWGIKRKFHRSRTSRGPMSVRA
jgi:hypothetical protein